jgi:hypothetical protein
MDTPRTIPTSTGRDHEVNDVAMGAGPRLDRSGVDRISDRWRADADPCRKPALHRIPSGDRALNTPVHGNLSAATAGAGRPAAGGHASVVETEYGDISASPASSQLQRGSDDD